jgi:hypothetical protein
MDDPVFAQAFENARLQIAGFDIAFVGIDDIVERYLFEVYCAMDLDTHVWNTFDTH